MDARIESKSQIAWLDGEGILRVDSKPGTVVTLEDVRDIVAKMVVICAGRRRPILVNLAGAASVSREARTYIAGPDTARIQSAAALLVTSPLARAIGNFFIGLNKSLIPTRLFTAEAAALAWLRGHIEAVASPGVGVEVR
ncbi:MAG: STAS/SEC14 domain-containing protein [Myxococcota bacterium]